MMSLSKVVRICAMLAVGSAIALAGSFDGKWVADPNDTVKSLAFTFQTNNGALTGVAEAGPLGPVNVSNGKVDGNKIAFEVSRSVLGTKVTTKYSGTLEGEIIKLKGENLKGSMDLVLRKK